MSRTRLITGAAFAGNLGWGAILPYQYAYVVQARHWGPTAGVLTGTLFCIGAVLAAPIAGRLADRRSAAKLAVGFELAAGAVTLAMGAAGTAGLFLVSMLLFGAMVTAAAPATQVMVLENVAPSNRRAVFAYQFTAMALGMAVGSFAAGWFVDLTTPEGMWPGFLAATVGFVASAGMLALAARSGTAPYAATHDGEPADPADPAEATPRRPTSDTRVGTEMTGWAAYRTLMRNRSVRLLGGASMLLAAGFYAQFETGLPAFALASLHVAPTTVGTAAAVNCVVIVALQWLVVKITGRNPGAVLLAVVGATWVLSWLLLELALFTGTANAGAMFVIAFAVFAVGETMYAPVLSPLTASVAPDGLVGTTLGAVSAMRTAISAVGPLVAGVLLTAGLPHVFVLLHVALNAAAIAVALRLWRVRRGGPAPASRTATATSRGEIDAGAEAWAAPSEPALADSRG